jgi:hypothetical protein
MFTTHQQSLHLLHHGDWRYHSATASAHSAASYYSMTEAGYRTTAVVANVRNQQDDTRIYIKNFERLVASRMLPVLCIQQQELQLKAAQLCYCCCYCCCCCYYCCVLYYCCCFALLCLRYLLLRLAAAPLLSELMIAHRHLYVSCSALRGL